MKKYNYYKDMNFLGGDLTITVDPETGITAAYFTCVDPKTGQEKEFTTTARCRKGDTYNEVVGLDIVKMKISKLYYEDMKNQAAEQIKIAKEVIKDYQFYYDFATRKINNIKHALVNDGGFTYYDVKPKVEAVKPVEKKTAVKITTESVEVKPVKKTTKTSTKKTDTTNKTTTVKKTTVAPKKTTTRTDKTTK